MPSVRRRRRVRRAKQQAGSSSQPSVSGSPSPTLRHRESQERQVVAKKRRQTGRAKQAGQNRPAPFPHRSIRSSVREGGSSSSARPGSASFSVRLSSCRAAQQQGRSAMWVAAYPSIATKAGLPLRGKTHSCCARSTQPNKAGHCTARRVPAACRPASASLARGRANHCCSR